MKLISMTDFVLEQYKLFIEDKISSFDFRDKVWRYANFLKTPLTIGQFAPCDLEGNVLEKPPFLNSENDIQNDCQNWEEAQSRVLFEGFEVEFKDDFKLAITFESCTICFGTKRIYLGKTKENRIYNAGIIETIEDLVKYNPQLTQTAINQLKL